MAKLIRVPELGIAIANVTIVEWLVKEGEIDTCISREISWPAAISI